MCTKRRRQTTAHPAPPHLVSGSIGGPDSYFVRTLLIRIMKVSHVFVAFLAITVVIAVVTADGGAGKKADGAASKAKKAEKAASKKSLIDMSHFSIAAIQKSLMALP